MLKVNNAKVNAFDNLLPPSEDCHRWTHSSVIWMIVIRDLGGIA